MNNYFILIVVIVLNLNLRSPQVSLENESRTAVVWPNMLNGNFLLNLPDRTLTADCGDT